MKRLIQLQHYIHKSNDTTYQINAAILPKRNIDFFFDTNAFKICADSGAMSCATPDEIYFIPGTYKHFTGITINGIAEELKVSGCRPVIWIFRDDKRENIEIGIEQVLRIPGLPIWLIFL